MSRPLVITALAALFVSGLAPILVMVARVAPDDLQHLLDERTWSLLERTLMLGLGAATVATLIGAPFGYLVARTDLPGAGILRPVGLVPLMLPPLFLAMTFVVLSDVRRAPATILVLGIATFPIVALFTAKAAERIDRRKEEAALLAGGLRAVLAMELPLLAPAVACGACIAFVFAINDFAVPDYVSSVGPKFNVYADEVFATWQIYHETGRAVATSLPLVVLTLAMLLPALALKRRGSLAVVQGDFQRPTRLSLGRLRWPFFVLALAVVTLTALVPLGRLVWEAGGGPQGWKASEVSASFGRAIELGREGLANSLLYASAAATLCLAPALVLGHAIERARFGRLLEVLCVLPIAVPAILYAVGAIAVWNHPLTADFYHGGGMVVLLYAGRFLVFPVLVLSGGVAHLDRKLEEAGQLAGAGPARRLASLVAPPLALSLAGGWALVFVLAMRELDAVILVSAANGTAIFKAFNAVHFGRDSYVAALSLLIVFLILAPGLVWSLVGGRRMEVLP